jgi:hypothetical protein
MSQSGTPLPPPTSVGAPDGPTVLTEADTLDGGSLLPGFTLPLRDLFGELDRQG